MKKDKMLIGKAAKISGLTIRTLQHYDNIGLLPASGRAENGRRYYTESDMMTLEQIVFYRGFNLSLEEIKERLITKHTHQQIEQLLHQQERLLFTQIESIKTNLALIEASREIARVGKLPPWELLSLFMQSLGKADLTQWNQNPMDDEQAKMVVEYFPSTELALDFYQNWKRLSIKAATYQEAGVSPRSHLAQKLAKDWLEILRHFDGKKESVNAFLFLDSKKETRLGEEKKLIEDAEPFLNECIRIYQISH